MPILDTNWIQKPFPRGSKMYNIGRGFPGLHKNECKKYDKKFHRPKVWPNNPLGT